MPIWSHNITIPGLSFLLTLILSAGGAAHGADSEPVGIDAATLSHDARTGIYEATGGVKVRWRNVSLMADKVTLQERSGEAVASGGFSLVRNGDLLTGDRMSFNLNSDHGKIENGRLFVKYGNFYLQGQEIERLGAAEYRVERGTFTTCDGEVPSWKFTASDMDISVDEYATGKNAVFYIKDVPVLYTPYMLFPVKRERQSGLLTPRFGNSNKKGIFLDIPIYWAISPSQEATFIIGGQTKRGVGVTADYRYLRPRGGEGSFRGYLINDKSQSLLRGDVSQKHMEFFTTGFTLKSDVNLVLDRDFYRDFAEETGDYNRKSLDSSVSLSKSWQRVVATSELRYVVDLDAPDNKGTLQKLPLLTVSGVRQRIAGLPLYISVDSNLTNFSRLEGIQGQRLDVQPMLHLYASPVTGAELNIWGGYRQRLYNAYSGNPGSGYHSAGLALAGGAVSSTLSKVYDVNRGSLTKIRHIFIPELAYSLVQKRQQDNLPFFDFQDRVVGENLVSYTLTNRLTGKYLAADGSASYRDLLSMKISQGYELSATRRDLLAPVDALRPFTDIRLEASGSPVEHVTFNLDTRYSPYRLNFSTVNLGFDLSDNAGNLAGLSYRRSAGVVNYLEWKTALSLIRPFVFIYNARYSFDRENFLESFYSIEYRHQCWTIALTYRDRPDNREFMVNFTLGGVGSMGKMKAF